MKGKEEPHHGGTETSAEPSSSCWFGSFTLCLLRTLCVSPETLANGLILNRGDSNFPAPRTRHATGHSVGNSLFPRGAILSVPKSVLFYGTDVPSAKPVPPRVKPLSTVLDDGGLRYIQIVDREGLRRIYSAVRERVWYSIAVRISNLRTDVRKDSFWISYEVRNQLGGIDFVRDAPITGQRNGSMTSGCWRKPDGGARVMLTNFSDRPQPVHLTGGALGPRVR